MTPSEILIVSCLGAAPLLLGVLVGLFVSNLYRNLHERLRGAYFADNGRVKQFLIELVGIPEWVAERRARFILVFWPTVCSLAGGFLAGSYMQFVFGWWAKFMELMVLTGG